LFKAQQITLHEVEILIDETSDVVKVPF